MFALAGLCLLLAAGPAAERATYQAKVIGITDGDTIEVLRGGTRQKVRLDGIDAPERGQAFAERARERVSGLAFGKMVRVEPRGRDRYGRALARVALPGGEILNETLVAEGLAWWYRRYAPKHRRLEELEEEARGNGIGLWADPEPTPPWLWRRARKRQRTVRMASMAMKSYRKELWFNVETRRGMVNITPEVDECLRESGVQEGLCLVNAMHITASVFINDDESGLHHDYDVWLEKLAPHEPVSGYQHNRTGEDNADAHMKRQIMGREIVVAVTQGRLDFGPWEQIFYGEFDGRRRKRVLVKIIGE